MSVRIQVVVGDEEAQLFRKWCKERGYMRKNGNVNFSSALAFLIRREIDRTIEDENQGN